MRSKKSTGVHVQTSSQESVSFKVSSVFFGGIIGIIHPSTPDTM